MGSVWKRLNRINKRASKFHFTASYSELWLEAGPNWQPTALSVVWTRKSRRVVSDPVKWEPTMKSPYIGMCVWPVPENKDITVTMFRDPNKDDYDNKDWFFILEDVNSNGKRKPVAQGRLNMKEFSTDIPTQHNLTVKLRPISKKVTSAKLTLTLTAELLREGKATDEDMRSIASLVSNSTMSDYGNSLMKDVDEEPVAEESTHIKDEIASLARQMENFNKELVNTSPEVIPVRTSAEKTNPVKARVEVPSTDSKDINNSFEQGSEINNKIKQIDILPKNDPKYRGFGSEFKSTYNGPIGDYSNGPTRLVKGSVVVSALHQDESVTEENLGNHRKSPVSKSNAALGKDDKKLPISPLARKPPEEKAQVFNKNELPPLPLRSLKTPEKLVVKATVESIPMEMNDDVEIEEQDVKIDDSEQSNKNNMSTEKQVGELVDNEQMESDNSVKYIRTKSQEFRDYQQEFVLSSTIDFGPLQPLVQKNNLSLSNKNGEGKVEDKSLQPVVQKNNLSLSNKNGEVKVEDKSLQPLVQKNNLSLSNKSSPQNTEHSLNPTIPYEEKESELNLSPVTNHVPSPPSEESSRVDLTSTPIKTEITTKTEITPSQSFLNNLNRNSLAPETETENSSSDSTPITEKSQVQTPSDPKMEKLLADKTNSLLRQNPSKTSNDLLEWSKSICSKYSNIKVTNFTTSWRNGMAFCALIHSFYPDLIPYDTLAAHDIKQNCKLAFEAGEKLGIPRVIEPESMVIKRIPDKLAVITYLHQLRCCLGQEETTLLYEKSKEEQQIPKTGVRKSFSEGNIRLFSRSSSNDTDRSGSDLPTIEESPSNVDIRPEKISEYRKRAKNLVEQARSESKDVEGVPELEQTNNSPPKVIMRQKSSTPKPRKDNRLSYIDNEIKVLDAEQIEIDKQAAILDKRLRETSEDDQLVYDALLQQWFTLVNKKNALLRRQMQLNILEKEDDLEKKLLMLQDELRSLSEMEDSRKTDEDRKREDLLLEELVLVVNQRNELVIQRDEEERMIEQDEQLDEQVTLPENDHLRNNKKDDCRMQ